MAVDDINTPCHGWHVQEGNRRMIRALLGGTEAMRAAGVEYLPRQIRESEDAYARRLQRSFLFPALRRTVETFAGRVLGHPIDTTDVAPPVRAYLDDVDRDENNLTVFARHVFFDAVAFGISWIFVDRDPLVPGSTLADARRNNNRPYLVHIPCSSVIGWRRSANGQLARVRIREQVVDESADNADWNDDIFVDQIRVIEPFRYRVYRQVKAGNYGSGEWVVIDEGRHGLEMIPLVPVYMDKTSFFMARPPLLDLAWLNVCHWQSASDQRHIEHIIRVPILLCSGFQRAELGELEIGADRGVIASNPQSTITYVEHSGNAAQVGRADLEDLESKMASLGAQVIDRQPVMETATKTATESAESGASLAAMSESLQDALNIALYYMGRMINVPDAGSVRVLADIPSATEAVEESRDPTPDTPSLSEG